MKKVKILPGCVSCGACTAICPQVFYIDRISKVKSGIDIKVHEKLIKQAAEICPVQAIKIILL